MLNLRIVLLLVEIRQSLHQTKYNNPVENNWPGDVSYSTIHSKKNWKNFFSKLQTALWITTPRMNTRSTVRTTKDQLQKIVNILRKYTNRNACPKTSVADKIRSIRKIYMIQFKYFDLFLSYPISLKVFYKKGFDLISDVESMLPNLFPSPYATKMMRIGKYMKQNIQTFQKKYKEYLLEVNCILMKKILIPDLLPIINSYVR